MTVEREKFFRNEPNKYSVGVDIEGAITSTSIAAGMMAQRVDGAACAVIELEMKKCSAVSFVTGIPGDIALAGIIPVDLVQYFVRDLRVEQKRTYFTDGRPFLMGTTRVAMKLFWSLRFSWGLCSESE